MCSRHVSSASASPSTPPASLTSATLARGTRPSCASGDPAVLARRAEAPRGDAHATRWRRRRTCVGTRRSRRHVAVRRPPRSRAREDYLASARAVTARQERRRPALRRAAARDWSAGSRDARVVVGRRVARARGRGGGATRAARASAAVRTIRRAVLGLGLRRRARQLAARRPRRSPMAPRGGGRACSRPRCEKRRRCFASRERTPSRRVVQRRPWRFAASSPPNLPATRRRMASRQPPRPARRPFTSNARRDWLPAAATAARLRARRARRQR